MFEMQKKENIASKNPGVVKTRNRRLILFLKMFSV